MTKEKKAQRLIYVFERMLDRKYQDFLVAIKQEKIDLKEDLQPVTKASERVEIVEKYKSNANEKYYDFSRMMHTAEEFSYLMEEALIIDKEMQQYDRTEKLNKKSSDMLKELESILDEMDEMVNDLPFY